MDVHGDNSNLVRKENKSRDTNTPLSLEQKELLSTDSIDNLTDVVARVLCEEADRLKAVVTRHGTDLHIIYR